MLKLNFLFKLPVIPFAVVWDRRRNGRSK